MQAKVYIDFGTGYELLNNAEFSHDFQINIKLENQVRQRKTLSGALILTGVLFDRVFEILDTDLIIELAIKVEINEVLQGVFAMSLFGEFNHNEKKATFTSFVPTDIYSITASYFEVQRIPNIRGSSFPNSALYAREESTLYYNVAIETTLNETDYQVTTDIEGFPTFDRDTRWNYFGFLYTITVSPGIYQHIFGCNVFSLQAVDSTLFLGNLTLWNTSLHPVTTIENGWFKIVFNPLGYTNDTQIGTYLENFTTIRALLSIFLLRSELSDNDPVCNYINLDQLSIMNTSEIFNPETPEDQLTLSVNDILEYLRNTFQLEWYINSADKLEFLHPSEFGAIGTIDISTTDVHNKSDSYFQNGLPKFERQNYTNCFLPDFDNAQNFIEYPRSTTDEVIYSSPKISHDISGILRNATNVEQKTFFVAWLSTPVVAFQTEMFIESSTGIISGVQVLNNELSMSKLFDTHFKVYRYAKKCEINGILETVTQRPVFAHAPIQFRSTLPSDVDLLKLYTTSNGDYLASEFNYDVKTSIGTLNLIK